MSADTPRIKLEVEVVGAGGTVDDLGKVAAAQDAVADSAEKAADAIGGAGKAADASGGRLSKLWEGLKAGAGAAASASAGLAGMASTLRGDLSESNKQAVAGLQGLSGVLGAFGPVGQLLSTGISLAAGAIATFGDAAEEATGQVDNFVARSLKALQANMQTTEDRANAAIASWRRVQAASESDFELFTPEELAKRTQLTNELNEAKLKAEKIGRPLEAAALRRLQVETETGFQAVSVRSKANAELSAELATQRNIIDMRAEDLVLLRKVAEARKAGAAPAAAPARRGGARAPAGPSAEQLETEAHLGLQKLAMAYQAFDAERKAATESARAQMAAYSTFAADAQAQAFYSGMLDSAIAAGTAAQVDSLRAIAAEAEGVAGVYDTLTGALQSFGTTAADGFASAAANALLFGGSLGEMVNEVTKALALQATVEAIKATATGLGYLAAGLFGYGPGLAAAKASFASAALWGGIAAGSAGIAAATGGLSSGGGGGMSNGGQGPTSGDLGRPRERDPGPVDREFNINLASGAGGARPLSRGDARAVAGALVDIFAQGGLRLETSRA
jgi:hypothetical protein